MRRITWRRTLARRTPARLALALGAALALAACGGGSGDAVTDGAPAQSAVAAAGSAAIPAPGAGTAAGAARLLDWPEFGLNPQRTDASDDATGITSANVAQLARRQVALPGTVDSSPIYLHAPLVHGAAHRTIVVTTTYGKTLAIDAGSGQIMWTFTPPGYAGWAGSAQITNTSPLADPDGRYVYAASPNGLINKLALADGAEAPGWPVSVTRDAAREKLGAALNLAGPDVIAATSGYLGDAPPYQGHVVLIDRASGRLIRVFNTLCSDRRGLLVPSGCPASDSAILSRAGAVVEPGGRRLLIDTGNGPWNGRTDFGDSVLELSLPGLRLRQSFTPFDQARLSETDTDLGSSAPVLLGAGRVLVGGKDGVLRVLELARLNGRSRADNALLDGEVQRLQLPGGGELFTAPAVWRHGGRTSVFLAGEHATAAYTLRRGRLYRVWQNATAGTSPVLAGGLLYVYEPAGGGIYVYRPDAPRPLAKLPGEPGHWNSPIVADGHVIEPEGDANDHATSGALEIFSAG